MPEIRRLAVVTGGNRGIGLGVCRGLASQGFRVLLGSRDLKSGAAAAEGLRAEGLDVTEVELDVTDAGGLSRLAGRIRSDFGGTVHALVNNAGILPETGGPKGVLDVDPGLVLRAFETNALGALRVCRAIVPLMAGGGCVVNLSSGMGQLSDMGGGYPAYRMSKSALNALTRALADDLSSRGIRVNSMCPGWVRTDMGGAGATRSVEEGADTAVWLADLPADGPTGGFFRDRKPIPW